MRSFGATNKNDLYLGRDGNMGIVVDKDAIRQNCETAIKAQLGEMIYAADEGMPIMQTVWDRFDPAQFEAAARTTLQTVEGVTAVDSFNVELVGDTVQYQALIHTIFGVLPIGNL